MREAVALILLIALAWFIHDPHGLGAALGAVRAGFLGQ